MRRIGLEELKLLQLDILENVHNYCVAHGITYFLSSGSLLGAVRHGGYIPWDDDIDIYMPRPSYDIFVRTYKDENFRVRALENDPDYNLAFAKVENPKTLLKEDYDYWVNIGVNIDVFPVDGVPNRQEDRERLFTTINKYRNLHDLKQMKYRKGRKWYKNLFLMLSKLFIWQSPRTIAEKLDQSINKENQDSEYVANLPLGNGIKSCFPRETMSEQVDIKFENITVKTMKGYHEYLSKTYGDYMKLPPKEKQITHHTINAYWIQ